MLEGVFESLASVSRGSFSWPDYLVFGGMLASSLAIGIFYAIKSRNKSNDEFLLGSRSLTCFPVSISLLASYISAILVLGGPAEAYYHGIQWWVICAGQIALPIAAVVFMPFFYNLGLTSVYEYLEMRYGSRWVRCTASGMYVVQMLLYQAVVIYAPALALASVTDFPLWISIITVGLIASVYTAIGGMKAVIWTDVLQLFILIVGLFAVVIKGLMDFGGFERVWEIGRRHDRTGSHIFTYGYIPYQRHTVPNIIIGAIVGKLSQYACTQTTVQRYASMKNLTHSYMAIFLVIPFFILLISLSMVAGLVLFATYEGCDPLAAGLIAKKDQILPFYVMERLSAFPGLPGLFVACIFSGSLSTISSGVNSQAAVTWEDVFSKIPFFARLSLTAQARVTKFIALTYGMLALGLAFVAGSMGGVLQAAIAVTSSVAGPLLAVFIMALFMPFTNTKGACVCLLLGTGVALGFSFGATAVGLKPELLPSPTDACPPNLNITVSAPPAVRVSDLDYPAKLLGLSYTQMGPLGLVVGIVSGILVSLVTGMSRGRRVDPKFIHPWVRWSVPQPEVVAMRVKEHSYDNKISTQF
ncbi:sodium-dependent multivitamin transporter-like [Portunus trituberculatus]|uniref:sodium-dependent multivitamin transporter-like n=1 Tax=Portunus trituberculatus TaxID=210409 RepID=UPI001E1CFF18|nr:sodium-dependent multivitamin transporter-like [Portunus trituberculatus]XP_045116542.1 sodium-dependent multivitamin transporter-like [Portunus trituberculatus]XP_045116543.1 sodium-dependent multivitamin transporter-like [Portunus trituberculatus]XP_045116544.1 sodium-dependent multivitamin transporter-like [Portunus trituberculatus]